ncbi:MAG: hypothetical protein FH758_00055 [Firmicutes bacterium]|nr:hypothetical protein [Bacillota bacterium]
MKVAVVGAGVAGLASAIELERLGVNPDIYEQRYHAGDLAPFSATMLDIGLASVDNQIKHLEKNYNIKLKPLNEIKNVVVHSPKSKFSISGKMGSFIKMGQDKESVQQQFLKNIKTKVIYKKYIDYLKIKDQYDWVIWADGSISVPIELNIFEPTFQGWVRGAFYTGSFEPNRADFWFDREFAREGFGCLTPFNNKSASLMLQVNGITRQELHDYWDTFVNKIGYKSMGTGYFETEFQTGRLKKHVVDNTLFVGYAGGFVEALWTQGVLFSTISGAEAARSIVKGDNYEKKVKQLVKTNHNIYDLRQRLSRLDNQGLDILIRMLKVPGVKQLASTGNYSGIKLISRLITRIIGEDSKGNDY